MSPTACPNCGAPATVAPGASSGMCTFCNRAFDLPRAQPPVSPYGGAPPPQYGAPSPFGAPPPQPPTFVVVPPGQSYNMAAATVTAASWAGFRLLMAIIPLFVVAMIGGITWFTSTQGGATRGSPMGIGGGWTGGGNLVCGGNDEISASDISSTTGITAGGNCHVTCVRCTIVAPIGVSAGGNAEVDLLDSHVTGTSGEGIVAAGNASVRLTGNSTLVGKVINSGNGSVTAPVPPPTAPPPVAPPPAKPTSGPSHVVPVPVPSSHH
jgi:hypothetical protein